MATLTVTAKGQLTLKRESLRHRNVAPGQKAAVFCEFVRVLRQGV
jgi:hypothetical protein